MIGTELTIGAAFLLGLAASGHCMVMCGGISAALGVATAKRSDGRPRHDLLVAYQLGRVASYTAAGLLFGGMAGGVIALLDVESVRLAMRALSALALLCGALVAFGTLRDPGRGIGRVLWPRLAPLGRRLFPVRNIWRAIGFGVIWGWMPCGFVYTVLLIAALSLEPLRGAATMAAFGIGTMPALLIGAFGSHRLATMRNPVAARKVAGGVLLVCAMLTLAGPWLIANNHMPWLHEMLPFACAVPR